jgi:hypothetical protein
MRLGLKGFTTMTEHDAPPSPEAAIAELEELERVAEQNSNEMIAAALTPEPETEMISLSELLLLGFDTRLGHIAESIEKATAVKAAGRNDIEALTAQVSRLAEAFEVMAGFIGCITESVESDADGKTRCYVRTRDENHGYFLSQRDGD